MNFATVVSRIWDKNKVEIVDPIWKIDAAAIRNHNRTVGREVTNKSIQLSDVIVHRVNKDKVWKKATKIALPLRQSLSVAVARKG